MITLYVSGPNFGLPDGSPFVIKAELLLKMAGVAYSRAKMNFRQAPKGRIPYIADGGKLLGDSHFIQRHLERQYGIDFSGGYDRKSLAIGWAAARMMEERFCFLNVHQRWTDDANFTKGPRLFFSDAPAVIRPAIIALVRRRVASKLKAQGIGMHSDAERAELAQDDVSAIAALIGDSRYLLGAIVSAADAGVFPFLWSAGCPLFSGAIGEAVRGNAVVSGYISRMVQEFFPDFAVG
jgi:glutathione S-transferase